MQAGAAIVLWIVLTAASDFQPVAAPRLLDGRELPVEVEAEALQRQYDALLAISPELVEYSARGPVSSVQVPRGPTLPTHSRSGFRE